MSESQRVVKMRSLPAGFRGHGKREFSLFIWRLWQAPCSFLNENVSIVSEANIDPFGSSREVERLLEFSKWINF